MYNKMCKKKKKQYPGDKIHIKMYKKKKIQHQVKCCYSRNSQEYILLKLKDHVQNRVKITLHPESILQLFLLYLASIFHSM